PAVVDLEELQREVQADGSAGEEVSVGQGGVGLPGILELDGLEAHAGPAVFEALADLGQALLDAEGGDEQVNRVHEKHPRSEEGPGPRTGTGWPDRGCCSAKWRGYSAPRQGRSRRGRGGRPGRNGKIPAPWDAPA